MYKGIRHTRFKGLGYRFISQRDGWQFVDESTKETIGPRYASERELLFDIDRFGNERGFELR